MSSYTIEASFHKHFAFMVDQFGFSIVEENSYSQVMGNARIVFAKPPTLIEIVKDRGQILASLGDERIERRDWVEFAQAVQFLSGSPEPVYAFPSLYIDETDDIQVSHVSEVMHEHCLLILSGDMSVMQLKEVMWVKRQQEFTEYFAKLQGNSGSEKHT